MRKIVCFLLTVSLLFTMGTPIVMANELEQSQVDSVTFHAPTIWRMIQANLEYHNTDIEFFYRITDAYLTDTELFLELIASLDEDDQLYLAKGIAHCLIHLDRVDDAVSVVSNNTQGIQEVATMIFQQAHDESNFFIDAFEQTVLQNQINTYAVDLPLPGRTTNITVSTTTTGVGTTVTGTVTFVSQTANVSAVNYTVRIYKVIGNQEYLAATRNLTVPANNTTGSTNYQIIFTSPGDYTLYAVVYNNQGLVEATTADTSTITVSDKWNISVVLPVDRAYLGTITLYDASGVQISTSYCLGKSANNLPMNQYNGDTPTGVYIGYLNPPESDTAAYGPYKTIVMIGQSGYIVDHCSHRSGIMIHGGREGVNTDVNSPSYPLSATNGCIRVSNAYQLSLQQDIEALISNYHHQVGIITVTEQ